jgi:superfamily II DNA or RNA helicase
MTNLLAPGARVVIRDAEWLVRKTDRTGTGALALHCLGISEIVRDREAIFLEDVEDDIEALDPVETRLVADPSPAYKDGLLFIESQLRRVPPTDARVHVGHRAAMDLLPYQLDPALRSLAQPRQRILIADAVGLGKTLEAGILLAELIRRGGARRILVVTVKSMMAQFQKEWWTRFTIPLVRLDSAGIQRVRQRIPTNHNPFHHFDRAIISIDTLKQDSQYRTYVENAWWDVIVIDEAHNVARRRGNSQRARVAGLLARRSDTLILLSATPHDGRAESFASLMNMLDPTAIGDPQHYGPEDIRGLFVRRFKAQVKDQIAASFPEREIAVVDAPASLAEEAAFAAFAEIRFRRIDTGARSAGELFRTSLEKALLSSPAACLQTVRARLRRLEGEKGPEAEADHVALSAFSTLVEAIGVEGFGKYQKLVHMIREPPAAGGFGWSGEAPDDRLVIFTERLETLRFLQQNLAKDLGVDSKAIVVLHGEGMTDIDQQDIVERFGRLQDPVRVLVCSDIAAEGINLHFLAHRMVHFDIPWSLMTFQQRNGRIDRYGQERRPQIRYLRTMPATLRVRGDVRVLEVLIRKDQQATENIGDPSAFMGTSEVSEQEEVTADAINRAIDAERFEAELDARRAKAEFDPVAALLGGNADELAEAAPLTREINDGVVSNRPTLFQDDYDYFDAALRRFQDAGQDFQLRFEKSARRIEITPPDDLKQRLAGLPSEALPFGSPLILTTDPGAVQAALAQARKEERSWPDLQYLWPLHPAVEWVNDKVTAVFRRHEAPVLTLPPGMLRPHETVFVMSGLIPNRRGHPLVHRWFGARFVRRRADGLESFDALVARTSLGRREIPNPGRPIDTGVLKPMLATAIASVREAIRAERQSFNETLRARLDDHIKRLRALRERHLSHLEDIFAAEGGLVAAREARKARRRREIDRLFEDHQHWARETMTTEDSPFLQVIAVLRSA